jgi:hypothetical protein
MTPESQRLVRESFAKVVPIAPTAAAMNGARHVLTLSATVLAIIAPCSPTEDSAHIPQRS